jgi:hypothetical protein
MEAREESCLGWVCTNQRELGAPSHKMGHIADPAGAVVVGCKVLPIFNEHGVVDGANEGGA